MEPGAFGMLKRPLRLTAVWRRAVKQFQETTLLMKQIWRPGLPYLFSESWR